MYICCRPPLRQYLMDGEFFVGAALATTLTKLALRYVSITPDVKKQNVSILQEIWIKHCCCFFFFFFFLFFFVCVCGFFCCFFFFFFFFFFFLYFITGKYILVSQKMILKTSQNICSYRELIRKCI